MKRRHGSETSYWRRRAQTVMLGVIEETQGQPFAAIVAAVDRAYPFGLRKHHPYKIWLDERRKLIDLLIRGGESGAAPTAVSCPACGVARGCPCRDIVNGGRYVNEHGEELFHDARRSRDSGPLFAGVPPRDPGEGSAPAG
jgi:hypothetical protein